MDVAAESTDSVSTGRARLAAELRRLRGLSGVSGRELGRRINMSQSKVSRIEAGTVLPSLPEVAAWGAALEASIDTRERLDALTRIAHREARHWPALLQDRDHLQDEIHALETMAVRVRTYQHSVVPGLLQTADYARRVFSLFQVPYSDEDRSAAIAARLRRQQLVFEPERRFDFLITEAALRWRPGPSRLLLAQLDRLVSISTLDNVSLGLIPLGAEASTTLSHGFVIYEGPDEGRGTFVAVEMIHGPVEVVDVEGIELYENHWSRLERMAVFDDHARSFLLTLAEDIRSSTG
ncbi:helix-turn-helix domain-containing protein [Saccharothrix yanglingensis]|uniref:Transcriptional regulator n=1 Tax=Saccharothrix yanglingensis TaxID=659496 RepID=A0ABU0XAY9_9PSEU|nr:helix-turn-helix transcriptional regulator [Saccharothrix yanglingensis]MDQ2589131.1 transcriptional regulator [Saccharothrix yanglingensis]